MITTVNTHLYSYTIGLDDRTPYIAVLHNLHFVEIIYRPIG